MPGYGLSVHHVQLSMPPGDEDVGRHFYVTTLGLAEVPKPAALAARGGLWLRADSLELHLGVDPNFRPARKAHPGILVRELHRFAHRLTSRGVDIAWDEDLPGYRRFYVADCWGNRLEFLSPHDR